MSTNNDGFFTFNFSYDISVKSTSLKQYLIRLLIVAAGFDFLANFISTSLHGNFLLTERKKTLYKLLSCLMKCHIILQPFLYFVHSGIAHKLNKYFLNN